MNFSTGLFTTTMRNLPNTKSNCRNISVSTTIVTIEENEAPSSILCSAESFPEPWFTWKFQGQELSGNAVLHFTHGVSRHQSGAYICEAANKHGVMQIKTQVYKKNLALFRNPRGTYISLNLCHEQKRRHAN